MKTPKSRKSEWPKQIIVGRERVSIYKRVMPNGQPGYLVANYAERDAKGKRLRRLDSYASEEAAIEAAGKIARQLSQMDVIAAGMTKQQSIECAAALQILEPLGIPLTAAASTIAEAVALVGDLSGVIAAVKFSIARNKRIEAKRVDAVVSELIEIKEARGASKRYIEDLKTRGNRFAKAFVKNIGDVRTADVQQWLDGLKLGTGNYGGFRRVCHLICEFAVARGYAADNVIVGVEKVKAVHASAQIFTPKEIEKLLAASSPEFLPALVIGAFCGLRSAELERLQWSDIDLDSKHIIVGADRAKTGTRRVVPVSDNAVAWLARCKDRQGLIWKNGHELFYESQQETAAKAGVEWVQNGLRHSFCSYRLSILGDAGRVSGEAGNSPQMVHKHYKELVRVSDGVAWFGVLPQGEIASAKAIMVKAGRGTKTSVARLPEVGTTAAN